MNQFHRAILSKFNPQDRVKISVKPNFNTTDSASQIKQLSPTSLAYLGDAVYELYVRSIYLLPPKRISNYHHQVVAKVRAETQAANLTILQPYLSDEEKEIIRRGRNAAKKKPRRLSAEVYQQATSLETLIGYLYLHNHDRLIELLDKLEIN